MLSEGGIPGSGNAYLSSLERSTPPPPAAARDFGIANLQQQQQQEEESRELQASLLKESATRTTVETNGMPDLITELEQSSLSTTTINPPYETNQQRRDKNNKEKDNNNNTKQKENLLQQIKDAGIAGILSYGIVQIIFWVGSALLIIAGNFALTGHWPDFGNEEEMAKLSGEAFVYVNIARFSVPLQIGLALGGVPWIQSNIVDGFLKKSHQDEEEEEMD